MRKRALAFVISLLMLIGFDFASTAAFADDVTWHYDAQTHTLTISGSGNMNDYTSPYYTPWSIHLLQIENLIVEQGVTSVGNYILSGAAELSSVTLPESLTTVGEGAFSSCPKLLSLSFPVTVTSIGDVSFSTAGTQRKENFSLNVFPGSYSLYYAIKNSVPFSCESVLTGQHIARITPKTGMTAYFPYTAKLDGTFVFYSESKEDPKGLVYDSDFRLINSNDDYNKKYTDAMDACDFSVTVNLEKGKTYYFAAALVNPTLGADLNVYIAPIDYYIRGKLYAMASPSGALSNVKLTAATMNGEETNGEYDLHITELNYKAIFRFYGSVYTYAFTPDYGDEYDIPVLICDMNGDRVVNAKDYAVMRKTDYPYTEYFEPFLNYKY